MSSFCKPTSSLRALRSLTHHSFSLTRRTLENIGRTRDTFLKAARKELDRAVWHHLFNASGLASLMDTTHHRKFNKQLEDDPPVVSEESITATALTLASQADTMFIESVAHHDSDGQLAKTKSNGPRTWTLKIFVNTVCARLA